MVPDSVRLGFTAEISLPNQGFSARFLGAKSQVRGQNAWLDAIRGMNLKHGYEGLYYISSTNSPKDEDIYRVFLDHVPPAPIDDANDVFRRQHGRPFMNDVG